MNVPDLAISSPVEGHLYCFKDITATPTAARGPPMCGWELLLGVDLEGHPG